MKCGDCMSEKLNDRFARKGDPKELIDLCTQCKMINCDGTPCDAYRAMERSLKADRKAKKPAMMLEQVSPDASEMIERSNGLRLMNLAIDALYRLNGEEPIKEDEALFDELSRMISALDRKRFALYGFRVDWHELELLEERGACG